MILTMLFAATLTQTAPAPAPAPAPARLSPEASDARCVVILGFIGNQPNQPAARLEAVRTGSAYYMGKLRGRNPGINLAQALNTAAQLAQTQKADVVAESQRCGRELTAIAAQSRPAPSPATPRKP